ncbi:MAG: hypothetical protein VX589_03945 [Myxococcota bacterium]|nr:hypothetical protein [Myxococcota bacterium]
MNDHTRPHHALDRYHAERSDLDEAVARVLWGAVFVDTSPIAIGCTNTDTLRVRIPAIVGCSWSIVSSVLTESARHGHGEAQRPSAVSRRPAEDRLMVRHPAGSNLGQGIRLNGS